MIYIRLDKNRIEINDLDKELKSYHLFNLKFWGFISNNNSHILNNCSSSEIIEITNYLDEENVEFEVDSASLSILNNINDLRDGFSKKIEKCRLIKNGEIDKEEYKKFANSVKLFLRRPLKEHQEKAAYHLLNCQNGANFSVPGSGKTTVALTIYQMLKNNKKVNVLFVVGPPASFFPWRNEFLENLGHSPDYVILPGLEKNERKNEYYNTSQLKELYLISFQTLMNDSEDIKIFLKNSKVKAMLILDEAHYIKQLGGNWANAALSIAPEANYRMILTGTPIPRSYTDLFNMFEFLYPDYTIIDEETKFRLMEYEKESNFDRATSVLEEKIGPLFYRVRKTELKLEPQVFNEPTQVLMNPIERKVYDAIFMNIMHYSRNDYLKNIELVSLLRRGRMIRLRQTISFTGLLGTVLENYNENLIPEDSEIKDYILNYEKLEIPAKIQKLLEMVKDLNSKGQKVVVWSNFIKTISYIEKLFTKEGMYCKKIIGDTPFERMNYKDEETREKIRDEFIDIKSGLDILIANPAACAESISLHKTCSNAIYYDLTYNCGQFLQSLDRIHRVGGSEEKPSYYYFLQYTCTMENDILENLNLKSRRMSEVIDRDYSIYSMDMFEENTDDLDAYTRIFKP